MTIEQFNRNGRCGLQEFLSKPVEINKNGVTPQEAEKAKQQFEEARKKLAERAKKLQQKQKQLWKHGETIAQNIWNKHINQQNFMQLANQMVPGLSLIPKQCMNMACEAVRKSRGESSITGIADSIKNGTEQSALSLSGVVNDFADAGLSTLSGIGDIFVAGAKNIGEMFTTFNIYQTCPRRFNDWIEQAAQKAGLPQALDAFTQIQNKFSEKLMRIF